MSGVATATRRGRPLMSIAVMLVLWVAVRATVWQSPWAIEPPVEEVALATALVEDVPPPKPDGVATSLAIADTSRVPAPLSATPPALLATAKARSVAKTFGAGPLAPIVQAEVQGAPRTPDAVPLPSSVGQSVALPIKPLRPGETAATRSRWRADIWLFVRPGSQDIAAPSPAPSYGASQAGAVLAYRLADRLPLEPEVYARGAKALVKGGEVEVAAGIRAKPIASVPVRLHAEARATRVSNRTEIRPSAYVTAGFDEADIVAGVDARGYAQAGYVGGRYETAFADGQIVADKEVAAFNLAKLRVGAGAWGGAQKGAERLDVGPSASIETELGGAPVRLSAEYRVRIAGNAAPGDGIAITLTTGF